MSVAIARRRNAVTGQVRYFMIGGSEREYVRQDTSVETASSSYEAMISGGVDSGVRT
jgi:hypothetical protein